MAGELSNEAKRKKVEEQLLDPNTQRFWADTLLYGDMPEDQNGPIQDYVYPAGVTFPIPAGTLDTVPNQFDVTPGWEPDRRGVSPSYYSPRIQGTLDKPSIQFPESAQTRT